MENQNIKNNEFAGWLKSNAFQPYWTYSYVNNSAFYTRIPAQYQTFMRRYVQNALWWNDGWVPYFHNAYQGLMATGLGGAIVTRLANKVFGSRLYFKDDSAKVDPEHSEVNDSIVKIGEWADEVRFGNAVHKAINYALASGTSALKVNKRRDGKLWVDAWRFDKFFPTVNGDGSIESATFFLLLDIPFDKATAQEQKTTYTLEEHRYFGDYTKLDGTILYDVPLCEYRVHKLTGSITNNATSTHLDSDETMRWQDLPKRVRDYLRKTYPNFQIGKPILMPFDNWLGVELLLATDGISSLPELPFGESILHKIIPYLQEWDYGHSASCTDMYLGKGRVLVPKGMASDTDGSANSGLDSNLYEKVDYVDPDNQKPVPIQFDLRAGEWRQEMENCLNKIAVNIGCSPSTLASFLQDNSPKTAREVSSQENETMQFVTTTRGVMEAPLNHLLNKIRLHMGIENKVGIRWTHAGMENPYILAETLNIAKASGFLSTWEAIKRFNVDENEAQLVEEYNRVLEDNKRNSFGSAPFVDNEQVPYFGDDLNDNENAQSTGIGD